MKLPFKKRFNLGFKEKDVPLLLDLGTLGAVCKGLGIDFWQISEAVKSNEYDFITSLLYQGYISACKERYQKPKYSFHNAVVWKEYMSQQSQKEFTEMMTDLFGEISKTAVKKKVAKKSE